MRKFILPITLMCIISGFFLAFQLKTQTNNTTFNAISQKNNNLVTIIQDLESEINNQENQIEALRNQLNEIQDTAGKGNVHVSQTDLMQAKISAGLTPVIGKGITISIDDNKEGLLANPNDDPNNYVIHADYLLNIVNELKLGGAEAIAINGQRLITTSEIRCVGNLILVNMTRVAPPYQISAIGSPRLMAESISRGQLELLNIANYPVVMEEHEQLVIPAYKGELQFKYATPQEINS